ncbi:MAG: arabinofuranosyltransferase [Candidatus Hodarchaeota archaeon]
MNLGKIKESLKSLFRFDIVQELFYSGIGCILVIIVFNLLPDEYHFTSTNFTENYKPKAIMVSIFIIFLLLFIIFNHKNSRNRFSQPNYKRNIVLFSIFFFTMNLFLYFNTDFIFLAYRGDNYFRTGYVNHMANSGYPHDYAYKDLSAFYAPLYWFILAIYARTFQIPSYKMLRLGYLFCAYFLPIILFESWKKIYNRKLSFIITVLTFLILFEMYYVLDHFISVIFVIPYFTYYFENCTNREFRFKHYIIAGFIGSLLLCSYFHYFLIIPVYYFISLFQNFQEFKKKLKRILSITFFIFIFSSWFWIPLIIDITTIGFETHQNYYFNEEMVQFPFFNEIYPITIIGIVFIGGIFFILKNYTSSQDAKIFGNMVLSVFLLFLIGLIGVLIEYPILHIRFHDFYMCALIIPASILYIELFKWIKNKDSIKSFNLKAILPGLEICIISIIIISQSYMNYLDLLDNDRYRFALDSEIPETVDFVKELDYEEKVFLTDHWEILPFLPIYVFLTYPFYSHPSALYNERLKFLEELSECEDSKSFHDELEDNDFGSIDYIFLRIENASKLVMDVLIERFPRRYKIVQIKFDLQLVEDPLYFKKIVVEDVTFYEIL